MMYRSLILILPMIRATPLPRDDAIPSVALEWGTEIVDDFFTRNLYMRKTDNLTAFATEGTNRNTLGVTAFKAGFSFTDSSKSLTTYTSQPLGFDHDGCGYAYSPTLSGPNPISPALVNSFTIGQVDQSSLGDCGFGAALIAAKSNKSPGLANIFTVTSNTQFIAHLWATPTDTARHSVFIDDQLLRTTKSGCLTLASFEPTGGLLVPLLEKAFAKFVDAYPSFKGTSTASGYNALEGIEARKVLFAMLGRAQSRFVHTSNYQQAYSNAVINCLNVQQPCAFATTTIDKIVAQIGINPAVNTIQVNKANDLFSFYDVDQKKRVTLVGLHY